MMLKPSFAALAVAIVSAGVANAWFRVACTLPIVQERVDPILAPGVPSQHIHTVHGSSGFGMNQTGASIMAAPCTSCEVTQDLSNYWTPTLYYHDPQNGTYEKVPNGGLLIYYQNRGNADKSNGGTGVKAFPPGFRMISGNAASRSQKYPVNQGSQGELAERAVVSSCLRYTDGVSGYNFYGFPTSDCESGLNARVEMPSCWDGVNLWLPGSAHTAYLSELDNGTCPPGFPVTIMHLFYEVTWDLSSFHNRWVGKYNWPFVYSNSDPTGFGWHGDFYSGWPQQTLQNAIDNCNTTPDQLAGNTAACPYLTVASAASAGACPIQKVQVTEPQGIVGPLKLLPGCNPLQYGPGDATLYSQSNCPAGDFY